MIRMICGFIVGIFGFWGFAVEIGDYQKEPYWDLTGLSFAAICAAVGGFLFYFGRLARIRKRKALDMAFSMYRNDKSINALQISSDVNIGEIEVRKIIKKAQTDGLFPEDAEIV